jgi:alpha-tubulin suppressor-like RCC1 family protein
MRFFKKGLRQEGYVLPATLMLGLGAAIVSVSLLQTTSISSQNLNNASYQAVAQEAANAGLSQVSYCVQNNNQSWTTLTPGTGCSGSTLTTGARDFVAQQGTEWKSSYKVYAPKIVSGFLTALSVGTVQLLANNGATVVQTFTAKSKITLPSTPTTEPRATGNMITEIKNEENDCAISNGKLYCWGDNTYGQLGRNYSGNTPPAGKEAIGTPVDVGSILTSTGTHNPLWGKTVTNVTVAKTTVCAIADGLPYCWGDNSDGQLGYSGSSITIPTSNVPIIDSGDLNNHKIVEISTASANQPYVGYLFAFSNPHTCALTEDGSVACWGFGLYRQLTGGGCVFVFFGFSCSFPSSSTPTFVKGYRDNTGPFAGKKAERVGASSHDSCMVAQGRMYCWGVPVPLPLVCASPDFHPYFGLPTTLCGTYMSDGYDMSGASGSTIDTSVVDPKAWDLSTNEACTMANSNFACMGITPAFTTNVFFSFAEAWKAPWTAIASANVVSSDNGADPNSPGANGLYCAVDNGDGKCAGNYGNTYTGSGVLGDITFHSLVRTTAVVGDIAIGTKNATKIAAGTNHGCEIANGQLFCWGAGTNGVLAKGVGTTNDTTSIAVPTNITTAPIGIDDGTFAAHSSISVGRDFACGIVNAQVFCWGSNASGKLGQNATTLPSSMSPDNTIKHPQRVGDLSTKYATKVSTGLNHACAIVSAQLWCWGDNTTGQLGIGTNGSGTSTGTPQQIGHNATNTGIFDTKRITDVSAGDKNTCAIADGQLYCWGDNSHRQLGNTDILHIEKDTPQLVNSNAVGRNFKTNLAVTAVSVGVDHVCAIANADAYCWGNNASYKTGLNNALLDSDPTVLSQGTAGTSSPGVAGPNGTRPFVSAISAGSDYTCAIINAEVSCWGNNTNGRTAQGPVGGTTPVPTQIKGTAKDFYATAISAGYDHTCAIMNGTSSGNLFCWGSRSDPSSFPKVSDGQLGTNDIPGPASDISTVDITGSSAALVNGGDNVGKSVTNISVGYNSSCDIANATIQCWGLGASGQIGNDLTASQFLPTMTSVYSIGVYTKPIIY